MGVMWEMWPWVVGGGHCWCCCEGWSGPPGGGWDTGFIEEGIWPIMEGVAEGGIGWDMGGFISVCWPPPSVVMSELKRGDFLANGDNWGGEWWPCGCGGIEFELLVVGG